VISIVLSSACNMEIHARFSHTSSNLREIHLKESSQKETERKRKSKGRVWECEHQIIDFGNKLVTDAAGNSE
jgi:hypothetical protein